MSDHNTSQASGVAEVKPPIDFMGPLELAVYKSDWAASRAYHRHVAAVAARRELEAAAQAAQDLIMKAARVKPERHQEGAQKPARGPSVSRKPFDRDDDEVVGERDMQAPTPGRVASRLLLARLFDQTPGLMDAFRTSPAVVLIDVPDRGLLNTIAYQWQDALGLDHFRFAELARLSGGTRREDYDAIGATVTEMLAAKERGAADTRAFVAVQLALPILAFTPSAETHLSKVILDAATARHVLPRIDGRLIAEIIRIVTGKPCRSLVGTDLVANIGLHEMLLAIRFDRTPQQCLDNLTQLAQAKISKKASRDLTLDELHGMDEAIDWAKSLIADVAAWRRHEIAWDALSAAVVLDGPPGTGKTTFARVVSLEMGVPLISATLAKWQSSGQAHLGDLLKAMAKDFDDARKQAPAILMIDELDSFARRDGLTHAHKDYVIEVINGFLAQLDGIGGNDGLGEGQGAGGRQGLIFIGATNDVRRCDPAIVRSGRMNRIIRVGLPGPEDIEKMLRVRLRGRLPDESLEEIAVQAVGSSGADVERIVNDASRAARQHERALTLADLRKAVVGDDDLPPDLLFRISIHEAGHIILSVHHNGPDGIHAVLSGTSNRAGFVRSRGSEFSAGTLVECRRKLQVLLAGRAAEELEFGDGGGNGAGGAPNSDLAMATQLAAALIGSYGLAGPHPLVYVADQFQTDEIIAHPYMRDAAQRELLMALTEAKRVIAERIAAVREVAARLRSDKRINGFEVQQILKLRGHQAEPLGTGEPETTARHPDPALKTDLDRSQASDVATAYSLDPCPLLYVAGFASSSLNVPNTKDLNALLPAVIADVAGETAIDGRWAMPLTGYGREAVATHWYGGSARRLRRVVEIVLRGRSKSTVRN